MASSRFGVWLPPNFDTLRYLDKTLEDKPEWLMYALDEILCVLKKTQKYDRSQLEFMSRVLEEYKKESRELRHQTENKEAQKIFELRIHVFESFEAYLNYIAHLCGDGKR